jgi:hypothetical protein
MVAKKTYATIRAAATHLADAGNRAVSALADGRTQLEPAFTDRMLGHIEEAMNGYTRKGIRWTAMTLTDRVRDSQESEFGADFAGVLDIDLEDYKVKKGFLAQAKKIEPFEHVAASERRRMLSQCNQMLEHTADAFLFLYSISGVSVVPAVAVVSASFTNPYELYTRSLRGFYEAHFECFVGDRNISASDPSVLETLRERLRARQLSYLQARQVPQTRQ